MAHLLCYAAERSDTGTTFHNMFLYRGRYRLIQLTFSPRRIAQALGGLTLLFVMASVCAHGLNRLFGGRTLAMLDSLLNINGAADLTGWFSSTLLLLCSLLLAGITYHKWATSNRFKWQWFGLTLFFLLLSADKSIRMHVWARSIFSTLQYRLLLPSNIELLLLGCIVAAIGIWYLHFVLQLEAAIRNYFILSAMIYFGGAIVLDIWGGRMVQHLGGATAARFLVSNIEEGLEMIGVVLFLYTFMMYFANLNLPIALTFTHRQEPQQAIVKVSSAKSSN
jgi:hypothetical protein